MRFEFKLNSKNTIIWTILKDIQFQSIWNRESHDQGEW